jgi:hypothetical protein
LDLLWNADQGDDVALDATGETLANRGRNLEPKDHDMDDECEGDGDRDEDEADEHSSKPAEDDAQVDLIISTLNPWYQGEFDAFSFYAC